MAQITLENAGSRIWFRGNTYPVKDSIRALGAHWDGDAKAWWVGSQKAADAAALVERLQREPTSRESALPEAKGAMVPVRGNTYPVKDQLRALGGRWDGDAKSWLVPESRLAAAQALVAGAPKVHAQGGGFRSRSYGGSRRRGCPICGDRDCPKAYNSRDLCQED